MKTILISLATVSMISLLASCAKFSSNNKDKNSHNPFGVSGKILRTIDINDIHDVSTCPVINGQFEGTNPEDGDQIVSTMQTEIQDSTAIYNDIRNGTAAITTIDGLLKESVDRPGYKLETYCSEIPTNSLVYKILDNADEEISVLRRSLDSDGNIVEDYFCYDSEQCGQSYQLTLNKQPE